MDVQRLTFDSYLYKRVVSMKPLQQLKITMLTLGSILRGKALAPLKYKPVDSAVRENKEVEKIYPNGIHNCIKDFLSNDTNLKIKTATLKEDQNF